MGCHLCLKHRTSAIPLSLSSSLQYHVMVYRDTSHVNCILKEEHLIYDAGQASLLLSIFHIKVSQSRL